MKSQHILSPTETGEPPQKRWQLGVDFAAIGKNILASGFFLVLIAYGLFAAGTIDYLAKGPWQSTKDGHGPFIILIALIAFTLAAPKLRALPARPALGWGWVLVGGGLFSFLLGRSQSQIFFEMGAHLPLLAGLVLLCRGWAGLKLVWFPILFLAFAVPLPGWLLDSATQDAKLLVSDWVTHLLYSSGYPIAHDGVTLQIGPHPLLVADACAGLNSFYSLAAVGVLYTYIMRGRSRWHSAALLAWILPAAFLSNMVRVALLVLITYHISPAAGQGFLHDFAGLTMFTVAVLSFFALDGLLQALPHKRKGAEKDTP